MATPYWEHRAALRQAAYDRANNKTVEAVSRAYDRTMRQLDEDINTIMATYTRKTGLSVREAYDFLREGVPQSVMDDLMSRVAVISDPRQRKQLGVMLRTDAYRARISRLDAIKASTRVGLTEAAEAELGALEPHLRHTADLAYNRSLYDIQHATSIGFQGVGVPKKALDTILKSKWAGTHYSTSVWQNRDAMAGILDRALMEVSGMGKLSDMTMQDVRGMVDLNKWRSQIKSKFKTEAQYAKYAANRLIRTESAYVAGQTTAVAYDECGIERYEFMATLDNRTSEKCSDNDGKIFNLEDKEVGVNWPPLHPFCRSSTACVIDGLTREGLTRAARDKDGKSVYVPRDMKYQEWQAWQKDGAPADVNAWRESKAPKPVVGIDKNSDFMLKLGDEKYAKITEMANKAPEIPRAVWGKNQASVKVASGNHTGQTAYNDAFGIHINAAKDAEGTRYKLPFADTFHESWHNIDNRLGVGPVPLSASGKWGDTLKSDYKRLIEARRTPTSTGRIPTRKEAAKSLAREFFNIESREAGGILDIMEGASNGTFETMIGHGKEYWKQRWALEKEAFANIGEMAMTNPKGYEMFQKMFPQSHKEWLDMLKGVL